MSKQTKVIYKILAWFFTTVIATGALTGCNPPMSSKYGPPVHDSSTSINDIKIKNQAVQLPKDKINKEVF